MVLLFSSCGKETDERLLVGTWEYENAETGVQTCVINGDGTGSYTMKIDEEVVTFEMRYEVKGDHVLIRFVNNEMFSEDDVFDGELHLKDSRTMDVKAPDGEKMVYTKK